jgi:hypothetical protein
MWHYNLPILRPKRTQTSLLQLGESMAIIQSKRERKPDLAQAKDEAVPQLPNPDREEPRV